MKKRIGILGGLSHESTIIYYRLLHQKYFEQKNDYYYPEIVVFSLDFQKNTDYENTGDRKGLIKYIMTGIDGLTNAGVDFIAIAVNSTHAIFPELEKKAKIPMLSIVETTVKEAKKRNITKALLLGIKFTMQSTFYQDVFTREGIDIIVPNEKERDEINEIIFKELTIGIVRSKSRKRLKEIIESYEADAVILGCTELPIILGTKDTTKKVLNPVDLHINAILKFATINS